MGEGQGFVGTDVVVVVYDGVEMLDVAGVVDVFDGAARAGGGHRVRLASSGGRDVVTSSGVRLGVAAELADVTTPRPPSTRCGHRT